MQNIMNKAKELGEAIISTPEYKEFITARDAVDLDVESIRLLTEYQQKAAEWQAAMQANDTLQGAKLKGEIDQLAQQIEVRPVMIEFTKRQNEFQLIMDQVNGIISQYINPEEASNGCSGDCGCDGGCDSCQ